MDLPRRHTIGPNKDLYDKIKESLQAEFDQQVVDELKRIALMEKLREGKHNDGTSHK